MEVVHFLCTPSRRVYIFNVHSLFFISAYRIAGMFGGINVWRIVELKVIGEIKFGEWIDFGHKDTIYQLKFGWLKFGESRTTRQIRQTFPPPNIPAIWYFISKQALMLNV